MKEEYAVIVNFIMLGEKKIGRGKMSQGSYNSGVQRLRGITLIDCPACGREQLRLLQSTTADNPGKFFVKCPRNEKGKKIGKDCTFFMWLEQYKLLIGELGMLTGVEHTPTTNYAGTSIESIEIWRSIEAMRVEVVSMNGRMNKLEKNLDVQFLLSCFIVLGVMLVLLVVLVK